MDRPDAVDIRNDTVTVPAVVPRRRPLPHLDRVIALAAEPVARRSPPKRFLPGKRFLRN